MDNDNYIPTANFCYIIDKQYLCTDNENIANAYYSIRKISFWKVNEWSDDPDLNKVLSYYSPDVESDSELFLLADIIVNLKKFAGYTGLSDNPLFLEISKQLNLAVETYKMYPQDVDSVRDIVLATLSDIKQLDRLGSKYLKDKTSDIVSYNHKLSSVEFVVTVSHTTMDMSVANKYDSNFYFDFKDLQNTKAIDLGFLDGGRIELISVKKDSVCVKWLDREFFVGLNSPVSTDTIRIDNPYLSSDFAYITFTYRKFPNYAELINMIIAIGSDEAEVSDEKNAAIRARKCDVMHFIDKTIEHGNTGLYVAKALLESADDWSTCEINHLESFRMFLLKAVEKGALSPKNHFGWDWMEIATKYNDPSCFMEDMELFYNILASAAEEGVVEAMDIMDLIWEPEQIIEED